MCTVMSAGKLYISLAVKGFYWCQWHRHEPPTWSTLAAQSPVAPPLRSQSDVTHFGPWANMAQSSRHAKTDVHHESQC